MVNDKAPTDDELRRRIEIAKALMESEDALQPAGYSPGAFTALDEARNAYREEVTPDAVIALCEELLAARDVDYASRLQKLRVLGRDGACKHEHFTHVFAGEDVCDDCGKSVDNAKCRVCHPRPTACKHERYNPFDGPCPDCGWTLR